MQVHVFALICGLAVAAAAAELQPPPNDVAFNTLTAGPVDDLKTPLIRCFCNLPVCLEASGGVQTCTSSLGCFAELPPFDTDSSTNASTAPTQEVTGVPLPIELDEEAAAIAAVDERTLRGKYGCLELSPTSDVNRNKACNITLRSMDGEETLFSSVQILSENSNNSENVTKLFHCCKTNMCNDITHIAAAVPGAKEIDNSLILTTGDADTDTNTVENNKKKNMSRKTGSVSSFQLYPGLAALMQTLNKIKNTPNLTLQDAIMMTLSLDTIPDSNTTVQTISPSFIQLIPITKEAENELNNSSNYTFEDTVTKTAPLNISLMSFSLVNLYPDLEPQATNEFKNSSNHTFEDTVTKTAPLNTGLESNTISPSFVQTVPVEDQFKQNLDELKSSQNSTHEDALIKAASLDNSSKPTAETKSRRFVRMISIAEQLKQALSSYKNVSDLPFKDVTITTNYSNNSSKSLLSFKTTKKGVVTDVLLNIKIGEKFFNTTDSSKGVTNSNENGTDSVVKMTPNSTLNAIGANVNSTNEGLTKLSQMD